MPAELERAGGAELLDFSGKCLERDFQARWSAEQLLDVMWHNSRHDTNNIDGATRAQHHSTQCWPQTQ